MPTFSWKVYAMAGAVVAAFAAAWLIQGVRWDRNVLEIRSAYQADQLLISKTNQAMLSNAILQRDEAQAQAAKLSGQLQEKLRNAKADNTRLANAVADGAVRLLINGKASSATGSVVVPRTGGTGSGRDVVQFELSDASRQGYFALRESITSDAAMIEYYKSYISQQCYREKK